MPVPDSPGSLRRAQMAQNTAVSSSHPELEWNERGNSRRLFARRTPSMVWTSRPARWISKKILRPQKSMSFKDKMTLSPTEKLTKFGRFPWKLLFNIAIVACATSKPSLEHIGGYFDEYTGFIDANARSYRETLGNGASVQDVNGNTLLYTVSEITSAHLQNVQNYWRYSNISAGEVTTVDHLDMTATFPNGSTRVWVLTEEHPYGPLDPSQPFEATRKFIDSLLYLKVTFLFNNTLMPAPGGAYQMVKYGWQVDGQYDMSSDVEVKYSIRMFSFAREKQTSFGTLEIIDVITIFLCVIHTLLVSRALRKSCIVYSYAKRRLSMNNEEFPAGPGELTWDDLDKTDKWAFFNLWHVSAVVGNIALVFAALEELIMWQHEVHHSELDDQKILRSLGCFMSWITLLKYLEWDNEFYMLVLTIRHSVVRVGKFCLMVVPMYVGYALIGMYCFGDQEDLFGNIFRSCRSLFALINGDSILLYYQSMCTNTTSEYCALAQIYLYTYLVIFITTVLNVFIFIIETGYGKATRGILHDEECVLDHDRLRKILDAADARGGISSVQLDSVKSVSHSHDGGPVHSHVIVCPNPEDGGSINTRSSRDHGGILYSDDDDDLLDAEPDGSVAKSTSTTNRHNKEKERRAINTFVADRHIYRREQEAKRRAAKPNAPGMSTLHLLETSNRARLSAGQGSSDLTQLPEAWVEEIGNVVRAALKAERCDPAEARIASAEARAARAEAALEKLVGVRGGGADENE